MQFNTIEEVLEDFRLGKMVLILDDEDRENEGDLIIAAEVVTPEHITFFAREACGLICLTITEQRATQLNLPLMVDRNSSQHETNFTVSIEAADGITTGISASDRARTVRTAVARHATPNDLVMPGHIFPLIAKQGGVLTRAGHTEAGCDLARLSGYEPASVIVEVMNDDGTMAKRPELERFAEKHQLKIGTIADLIHYRAVHDTTVLQVDSRKVATDAGEFDLTTFRDSTSDQLHFAMSLGTLTPEEPCLVRVQTVSFLRDVLGTVRPGFKGSWSTHAALSRIAAEGSGVLVLVNETLSAESELEQIMAYPDIPAATRSTIETGVYRVIGSGSQILRALGVGKMRLLANPSRYNALSGFDLEVTEFIEFDDEKQ